MTYFISVCTPALRATWIHELRRSFAQVPALLTLLRLPTTGTRCQQTRVWACTAHTSVIPFCWAGRFCPARLTSEFRNGLMEWLTLLIIKHTLHMHIQTHTRTHTSLSDYYRNHRWIYKISPIATIIENGFVEDNLIQESETTCFIIRQAITHTCDQILLITGITTKHSLLILLSFLCMRFKVK